MKRICIALIALCLATLARAAVYTNIQSGSWSVTNNWQSGNRCPNGGGTSVTNIIDGGSFNDSTNDLAGTMTNKVLSFTQNANLTGNAFHWESNLDTITVLAGKTAMIYSVSLRKDGQLYINDATGYTGLLYLSNVVFNSTGGFLGIERGSVTFDGCSVDGGGLSGFRIGNNVDAQQPITVVFTNGSTLDIDGNNNLNLGFQQTINIVNYLDISGSTLDLEGRVWFYNANANLNNYLRLGPGGKIITPVIIGTAAAYNGCQRFVFDGGTFTVRTNDLYTSAFFYYVDYVAVSNRGAVFDTDYNISIQRPILNAGTGTVAKIGTGKMTIVSNCTYTGSTIISNGTMIITGAISNSARVYVESQGTLMLSNTTANIIGNGSSVYINSSGGNTGKVNLITGMTDAVDRIYFDNVPQPRGTYGSTTSAAMYKDNTRFIGTGVLIVSNPIPVLPFVFGSNNGNNVFSGVRQ